MYSVKIVDSDRALILRSEAIKMMNDFVKEPSELSGMFSRENRAKPAEALE